MAFYDCLKVGTTCRGIIPILWPCTWESMQGMCSMDSIKSFLLIPICREGVILDRHYVHTKCSPSRAALLTGRYAWKMGRQRGAIERFQPTGLSTRYKLLPQMLKKAGYRTHAVGKWHLGYCNNDFLPTRWEVLKKLIFAYNLVTPGGVLTHSSGCTSSRHTTGQGKGCKKEMRKNEESCDVCLQDDHMLQLQVFKRHDRLWSQEVKTVAQVMNKSS